MFKMEMHMRHWRLLLIVVGLVASPTIVLAQQQTSPSPKPNWPAEIAKASRIVAGKNDSCGLQAKEKKLKGLKRRRFIRECVKK
jgi:hypothetical protein